MGGGIRRDSEKCFLLEVPDGRAKTLQPLIFEHILSGLHIISNGWASYANVASTGYGNYMHSSVIHKRNFIDPGDSDVHTQSFENLWIWATRKIC